MMHLILFIIALLFCSFIIFSKNTKNKSIILRPPPGPKGLPFIGNLHQYDSSRPHVYLAKLAKTYGSIVSLRLGYVPMVVVQSAKLAKEVLKTQDLNFCSRPLTVGLRKLSYNGLDIAFCPYNEYFREVKKISVIHLLNSIRVRSFAPIQQDEITRLMNKISSLSSSSSIVNLSILLPDFACNNICKMAFGRRYENNEGENNQFRRLLDEEEEMFVDIAYSDYFPSFGGWIDKLMGKSARLEKTFLELDAFYQKIIDEHLDPNKCNNDNHEEDLIDVLLHLRKERSFAFELTLDHVKAILMNVFAAGTDTSSTMVIWAMTELIKNPNTMKKVQDELRKNVPPKTSYIVEDDLQNLEYFKAVVKETFRLHPSAPLLIAHQAIRQTKIDEYDIEPETIVLVNAWVIGRDPVSWNDPDKFMPERFLGSSIDFKGQDFELIPFGAGRRMCPGVHLGTVNFELTLANLLHFFDWKLPIGVNKEDVDTDTLPGITMFKRNPLCLMANKIL
ncbi:cytochrome P450 83B1-like [Silene latifolia]|uniref:cytochrome P450 83B1-like n=1 Tax=Silene latifolia TaxID=37657 RepID=UPI003D77568F